MAIIPLTPAQIAEQKRSEEKYEASQRAKAHVDAQSKVSTASSAKSEISLVKEEKIESADPIVEEKVEEVKDENLESSSPDSLVRPYKKRK